MHVTNNMIRKELRLRGIVIRSLLRFKQEKSFVRANILLRKYLHWKYPSDLWVEEKLIPRGDGTALRVIICRPVNQEKLATGVLWLHGGGYAFGKPEQDIHYAHDVMSEVNAVVVLPDYRLSVEAPFPAALDDAYVTLLWLKEHAVELGINKNQLFVAGESAGGGLTACVSAFARDKGEVNIAFQMPLYPMLDDRMNTASAIENDAPMWNSTANAICWKMYLRDTYGTEAVSPYAAPARLTDFSGLPPTYTFVGDIEPFYDETLNYITALQRSDVLAELDVYEGCYHSFDIVGSDKPVGKLATKRWIEKFAYAAENYYAEN